MSVLENGDKRVEKVDIFQDKVIIQFNMSIQDFQFLNDIKVITLVFTVIPCVFFIPLALFGLGFGMDFWIVISIFSVLIVFLCIGTIFASFKYRKSNSKRKVYLIDKNRRCLFIQERHHPSREIYSQEEIPFSTINDIRISKIARGDGEIDFIASASGSGNIRVKILIFVENGSPILVLDKISIQNAVKVQAILRYFIIGIPKNLIEVKSEPGLINEEYRNYLVELKEKDEKLNKEKK
ncbi:MAG: hypothetical protein ACFFCS_05525 [Candidatus Hodarchaeota archaeon]